MSITFSSELDKQSVTKNLHKLDFLDHFSTLIFTLLRSPFHRIPFSLFSMRQCKYPFGAIPNTFLLPHQRHSLTVIGLNDLTGIYKLSIGLGTSHLAM